eukprot:403366032
MDDVEFLCESLKISCVMIGIYENYFRHYVYLREFQLTVHSTVYAQDFTCLRYFPQNIEKLVMWKPAQTLKQSADERNYIESSLSLLSIILQTHTLFESLEQLEISIQDLSLVAEHSDKLSCLNLLVLRNLDESFNALDNLKNYLQQLAKLMKGRHLCIRILDGVDKYKTGKLKIKDLSIFVVQIQRLLQQVFQEGLDQEQSKEFEQNQSYIQTIYQTKERELRKSDFVKEVFHLMICKNQYLKIEILLNRNVQELETIIA